MADAAGGKKKLVRRVVTALCAAAFVVCALVFLPFCYVLPAMILLAALVQLEFSQMAAKRYEVAVWPGVAAGVMWLVGRFYFSVGALDALVPLFFALAVIVLFRGGYQRPVEAMGVTSLGIMYVPVMLTGLIGIGARDMGLLLYVISIVKISDMGGFAFGVAFGRHKMCPTVSPNKSWEGMAGSVFAACLVSCAFIPMTGFAVGKSLALGAAAAIVGTLGDLVESRFKRACDVKDSATFMPAGMGGFLDMFDSLIFAPALLARFL